MEQTPADARAAPSASEPNDVDMGIASSPKRPRDPAQDNKVSPRATQFDPAKPRERERACPCSGARGVVVGRRSRCRVVRARVCCACARRARAGAGCGCALRWSGWRLRP
eukprot:scaffold14887_cov123-Isochrysis_galbana.AAC.5